MSTISKCIFDDSSKALFYDSLETFESFFVDSVLLDSIAKNGDRFKNINFRKNKIYKSKFYNILIKALDTYQPFLIVNQMIKKRLEFQCCFYNFGEAKGESFIYMVKNAMDWNNKKDFYCQVLNLIEPEEETIINFWRS